MKSILTMFAVVALAISQTGCQTAVGHRIGDIFIGAWEATHDTGTNAPSVPDTAPTNTPSGTVTNAPNQPPVTSETPADMETAIPAGTKFLHADVSGWPVTTTLKVRIVGRKIYLDYDKAKVWKGTDEAKSINGNPWVIVKYNGQWYAATWEWLGFGQTMKDMSGKTFGSHIKKAPLSDWEPKSGETVGFMVSGLARDTRRNSKERSQVVWVKWP